MNAEIPKKLYPNQKNKPKAVDIRLPNLPWDIAKVFHDAIKSRLNFDRHFAKSAGKPQLAGTKLIRLAKNKKLGIRV